MSEILNRAFEAARKLSLEEQDALGRELLERLADAKWDALFADPRSKKFMAELSDEIDAEIAAGNVIDGDPGSRNAP